MLRKSIVRADSLGVCFARKSGHIRIPEAQPSPQQSFSQGNPFVPDTT